MTLKRRFLVRNGLLVVMLLLLGAASIWGLLGLRQQIDLALYEYSNLQTIESAEAAAAQAQALLTAETPNVPAAIAQVQLVEKLADSFGDGDPSGAGPSLYDVEKSLANFVV